MGLPEVMQQNTKGVCAFAMTVLLGTGQSEKRQAQNSSRVHLGSFFCVLFLLFLVEYALLLPLHLLDQLLLKWPLRRNARIFDLLRLISVFLRLLGFLAVVFLDLAYDFVLLAQSLPLRLRLCALLGHDCCCS